MIAALLPVLGAILKPIAESLFPDPADKLKAQELQNQLQLALLNNAAQLEQAAASVVLAEARGESWLQRSWRPLLMLFFAGLIGARWFGYSAPGIGAEEYLKLWDIVELGLGGYVIGRSAEKVVPALTQVLRK
jgi:hypothetical protein